MGVAYLGILEKMLWPVLVLLMIGTSAANVSTRAKKLREAGVELPQLTSARGVKATIDVESLNERLKARLANA